MIYISDYQKAKDALSNIRNTIQEPLQMTSDQLVLVITKETNMKQKTARSYVSKFATKVLNAKKVKRGTYLIFPRSSKSLDIHFVTDILNRLKHNVLSSNMDFNGPVINEYESIQAITMTVDTVDNLLEKLSKIGGVAIDQSSSD